jgi:hypothetical protein
MSAGEADDASGASAPRERTAMPALVAGIRDFRDAQQGVDGGNFSADGASRPSPGHGGLERTMAV